MKISSSVDGTIPAGSPWLALPLFDDNTPPAPFGPGTPIGDLFARLAEGGLVSGSLGELTPVLGAEGLDAGAILAFGVGKRSMFDAGLAFSAGVALAKRLGSKPRESVVVVVPAAGDLGAITSALVEGIVVGSEGVDLHRVERGRKPFGNLTILSPGAEATRLETAVRRGEIVGQAVNLARTLGNTPPAEKTPPALAERFRTELEGTGVEVAIWDESKIASERFGGLLGVAAGSDIPPRFVVMEYRKGGEKPTLALVGKGVTFDSGGLSLKPSASMEDMKNDMTGGAVVLATLQAVARLELPVNVVGYVAMTENMTGGRAMKLGDVLTIRNGKTVEVLNTDAEGRLILADTLSYAAESKPDRMLDLATLTGACLVALGNKMAGLFSNDNAFAAEVNDAARKAGERTWRLPLDADFYELIRSNIADLKNVGGKWGGASSAAKFLEQFVADVPWVHLDIAGPSWSDSEGPSRDPGGTGCFVRTLVRLLEAGA